MKRTSTAGIHQVDAYWFVELQAWRDSHPGEVPASTDWMNLKHEGWKEGVWVKKTPQGWHEFKDSKEELASHEIQLEGGLDVLHEAQADVKYQAAQSSLEVEGLKKASHEPWLAQGPAQGACKRKKTKKGAKMSDSTSSSSSSSSEEQHNGEGEAADEHDHDDDDDDAVEDCAKHAASRTCLLKMFHESKQTFLK